MLKLPIAMKVAAKTIGFDLVSVQPLSAPSGNIMYTDYIYDDPVARRRKEMIERRKKVIEELLNEKGE